MPGFPSLVPAKTFPLWASRSLVYLLNCSCSWWFCSQYVLDPCWGSLSVAIQEHVCSYSFMVFFLCPIGRVVLILGHVVGSFRPLLPSYALTVVRSLFSFVLSSSIESYVVPDVSGGSSLSVVPGDTVVSGRHTGRTDPGTGVSFTPVVVVFESTISVFPVFACVSSLLPSNNLPFPERVLFLLLLISYY